VIRHVGYHSPVGEAFPVESSRDMQLGTRFVRLQVLSMRGVELGDPGPDDADMYARASLAGQDLDSAVINSHDRFSFPKPYHPFTWLKAVTPGAVFGEPVSTITVEVHTADARSAGTDDDVSLRLGPGLEWTLDKRLYDDFERDDRDTYSVPIDSATRRGLSVGDIRYVEIAKSRDGVAGGWKLGGVKLTVNGRVLYRRANVNRWLEDNKRTWRAPGFAPSAPVGPALPVWLDLREDDSIYGADDQGDVNSHDARNALARGYAPGTVVEQTIRGGERYSGRIGKDGDDAILRYRIDTLDLVAPPPIPKPPDPPPPPPPDQPPPPKPDLVITALNQLNYTVKNQGGGAAGRFFVTLVGVASHEFTGLAAGASETRSYNNRQCEGGTSEAQADSTKIVDESDETNNVFKAEPVFC
jgi:CARDB/PLAT/LH2 domain